MWASLGANILGTASKELMISLPFFLLLFDRAVISGTWRGAIRKWAWYLAHLVPPIAQVVLLSVGGIISGTKTVGFDVMVFTPKTYFLTQMEVICHYLRLSFWPSNLTLDYLDWPERKSLTEVWPFALVLIMLGSATAWGVLKNRLWGMIAAGFFLYLGPTSSIMPIQDAAFEHRMYLPLVSLVVLVVLGLAMTVRWLQVLIPDRRGLIQQVAVAGVSVVVFSLAFRTVVRNADYASPLSLYRQNFESRPNNPRVMAVYANMLSTTGNRDQALELMGRAVTLPRLNWTWNIDYAEMLHKSGKTESGLAVLDALHAGNPTDANINQHRALYYMSLNRMAEAERAFRLVLEHQPENWHSQFYLSVVLWDLQREGEARALWKSLTEKDPAFLPARAEQVRDYVKDPGAQAIQFPVMAKVALAVDRGVGQSDPRVADTLAMALARAGRFSEAVDAAQRAARLAEQAGWKPRLVALVRERAELYALGRPYLPVELEQYRLGLK
jgi:Flp pilus assembly protein TadD